MPLRTTFQPSLRGRREENNVSYNIVPQNNNFFGAGNWKINSDETNISKLPSFNV